MKQKNVECWLIFLPVVLIIVTRSSGDAIAQFHCKASGWRPPPKPCHRNCFQFKTRNNFHAEAKSQSAGRKLSGSKVMICCYTSVGHFMRLSPQKRTLDSIAEHTVVLRTPFLLFAPGEQTLVMMWRKELIHLPPHPFSKVMSWCDRKK